MKIVAIITEYNPFHNGHAYQIKRVREIFGDDTAIIAIMSGSFTQRGENAIADKGIRSRAAVDSGVNLVLELPFPYSASSAEFFASAGVYIADRLGVVDYLVFGTETENPEELIEISENMIKVEFSDTLKTMASDEENESLGYPKLLSAAYGKCFGTKLSAETISSPNNILAIEYLKALKRLRSKIIPFAIKREGAGYNDGFDSKKDVQSASAIREVMTKDVESALNYVPNTARIVFCEAISNEKMPSDLSRLDTAVISHFRLNSPKASCEFHDAAGGLYNRILEKSRDAESISSLTAATLTKKYTAARIRRAILFSFFGVTSSEVRTMPEYTQVLAADTTGCAVLKRIKKMSDFCVITKPSGAPPLPEIAKRQKSLSDKAESVYGLTLKKPNSGRFALTFTPYVKK